MKYVLHDWDDDRGVTILSHCRHPMAPGGLVLVVDNVIRRLLARAGLQLTRVVPTACPLSIVEGAPA